MGSHVVAALLKRGYEVHACVTARTHPDKRKHLDALNADHRSGSITFFEANLLDPKSYDEPFENCAAVLHTATAMAYGGANDSRQIYDGAVEGTRNVLDSVKAAGTVSRFVYTSSFAAIRHPAEPGYVFSEKDWASDHREGDEDWNLDRIDEIGENAYAMAKVEAEQLAYRTAENDGRFDAISVCPAIVLGPLLSRSHELVFSWQWFVGRMLRGKPCKRMWQSLWNIVDVRDVGEAHALVLSNSACQNGSRYQLTAHDPSGLIDIVQLQAHLQRIFPRFDVGGAPPEMLAYLQKHGQVFDGPRGYCDKAREELGLEPHSLEDTLRDTGKTLIELQLVEPALKA